MSETQPPEDTVTTYKRAVSISQDLVRAELLKAENPDDKRLAGEVDELRQTLHTTMDALREGLQKGDKRPEYLATVRIDFTCPVYLSRGQDISPILIRRELKRLAEQPASVLQKMSRISAVEKLTGEVLEPEPTDQAKKEATQETEPIDPVKEEATQE